MHQTIFRTLMVTLSLLATATIPASAQIPVPQVPAVDTTSQAVETTPSVTPMPSASPVDRIAPFSPGDTKVEPQESYSGIQRTPEAEALTQQMRQKEREDELANEGFKWQAWSEAGPKIEEYILDRDPKKIYISSPPQYRDFAVTDLDGDNEPDVIVYNWSDCVASGCPYVVYFNNKNKKPAAFITHELKKHRRGVKVDSGLYFKL